MRTIIAGSRNITDYALIDAAMRLARNRGINPVTQVVCGMARGVDMVGYRWAVDHHIPVAQHPVTPADWNRIGRLAGFQRNQEMARNADALVAIWDGHSPGTRHMIRTAEHYDLRVFVFSPTRWAAACK